MIDQDQRQRGILPAHEALGLAREAGLDLVEVSPTERPPVCRIMDYGKFKYERKKRQKHAAGGHVVVLKEIRLRPKTDAHDRLVKMNRAKQFLADGHKVQFTMLFRGRERVHRQRAIEAFNAIVEELGEVVKVERYPAMEGRRMTMVVIPIKQRKKQAVEGTEQRPSLSAAQPTPEPEPDSQVTRETGA